MKKNKFLSMFWLGLLAGIISFSSCSDDNDDNNNPDPDPVPEEGGRSYFNVVLGVGDDGNEGVYAQAQRSLSLSSSTISFNGYGRLLPAERTARVYSSNNGGFLYSLDYGGGTITSFKVNGGDSYTQLTKIDVTAPIGTHPRWGKVSDEMLLLHNVTTANIYNDVAGTEYSHTEGTAQLVAINLNEEGDMELGAIQRLAIPRSTEDVENNLAIWRIDAPLVHNGKVYYGVAKRGYNPNTGEQLTNVVYSTTTLVADYPSLTNLKTISSANCTGENYGYRTPTGHLDEQGDIYQLVGNGRSAMMLKIANGDYDNTYAFDLSGALNLGYEVGALGWFYVGNGIGYIPFYNIDEGQGEAASSWSIARVDVYNKTAVKMNIPYKLWLRQYQSGVLHDGKFYMALAPVGAEGAVYIFDPTSTSADGYTVGSKLNNMAGQFYIGVF